MGSNYGVDRDFGSSGVKVRMGSVREPEVMTGGFMDMGDRRERKLECQGWHQCFWPYEKVGVKENTQWDTLYFFSVIINNNGGRKDHFAVMFKWFAEFTGSERAV